MKPLNLYRKDGDRAVWERAEADAQAAERSVSDHVVAVLRDQQKRDDRAVVPAPGESIEIHYAPADHTR